MYISPKVIAKIELEYDDYIAIYEINREDNFIICGLNNDNYDHAVKLPIVDDAFILMLNYESEYNGNDYLIDDCFYI